MAEVVQIKGPDGKTYSVRLPEGKTAADLPSDPKARARLLARILKFQGTTPAPASAPVGQNRASGEFTNDEAASLGLGHVQTVDGASFLAPPRPDAPVMFGPPKAPEGQGGLAVTRKMLGRTGGPLELAAQAGKGLLYPSESPSRALVGATPTGNAVLDTPADLVYGVADLGLGALGVAGGAMEGAAGLVGDAYNAGAGLLGVENPDGLGLAKDLSAMSEVAVPELAGISSVNAAARAAGSFGRVSGAARGVDGPTPGPYGVQTLTAGENPGAMVYPPPAVVEADPMAAVTEQARRDAQDYLSGVAPVSPMRENAAVGQAALDLGVQVPTGAVTDPGRVSETLANPLMFATGRNETALAAANAGLAEKFGSVVQEVGNPRSSLGAAGDNLRESVLGKLNNSISALSREYDEFDSFMDQQQAYQLPENVADSLEEVLQRRLAAGAEDNDTAFIGEIANLVRKNTVIPDQVIVGKDGLRVKKGVPLSKLPGVTWQGLKDARSGLRAITANIRRGSQLTPKQRDMITMVDAITEGMSDVIRKYAPADKAEAMVDQFLDLDRRYAIAQDARREMEEAFNPDSISIMSQLRKAFNEGGKSATSTIERLRGLGGQAWDDAKAVMLHNLGANDDGAFDASKFAKAWSGIAPEVREQLLDAGHRADLDAIATVGKRLASIKTPSASAIAKNTVQTAGRAATMFIPGFAILDGVNAAHMLKNVFTARALASPYTAKQAAKLYRAIERAENAQSDAARALGYTQFSNQLKRYMASAGVTAGGAAAGTLASGFFGSNLDRDPEEQRAVTSPSNSSRYD